MGNAEYMGSHTIIPIFYKYLIKNKII